MAGDFDGLGLVLVAAGSLLTYAGVKGYSIPHALQAFVGGQLPAGTPQYPITGSAAASGGLGAAGSASGAVADFEQYVGKVPYVWDGASPVTGWDCSGSCNYVLCHDAGLPIPGYAAGTFTGQQHGPSTFGWLAWAPGNLTKISRAQAGPGDLVIWLTHMGVVVDGTSYISAYDTADGTVEKPISGGGPAGELATFWSYTAAPNPRGGPAPLPVT